ncbi:MAG TPA: 3-phosphoshikimate 1-carboxyvinyltransferase [Anaerolineae bacterium]|nr:3-phosphoshikimate 1-carboxyvinyltransferase [Anaerolineae bacterium]
MEVTSHKSRLEGTVEVPPSKSHTIRAVILGALAHGKSVIEDPLDSFDTRSAVEAVRAFGARVEKDQHQWIITGVEGKPHVPEDVINVGNSGTTLYMIMGTASLVDGWTVLTGDEQIRQRTALPLMEALEGLGVKTLSTRGNGKAPLMIKGPMKGGRTTVRGISSQYVSSLIMACPLARNDSEISVIELNERPYIQMTLNWLDFLGVSPLIDDNMNYIRIQGRKSYTQFIRKIPGDFSSATFLLCAGVLAGGTISLRGLEMDDPQGDKIVIDILKRMGAHIEIRDDLIIVKGGRLKGIEIDMNSIPDAVPMLAVCACFAGGTTVLANVPQARIKETDRIAVMSVELTKLGANVEELPDGLVIQGTGLKGGHVHGHGDHRVVMALTVAGYAADRPVSIDTAEAVGVTFPRFWETMRSLGAKIEMKS